MSTKTAHWPVPSVATLVVLVMAWATGAPAFNPPVDTEGPLTVRIEGPEVVREVDAPLPVRVIVKNTGTQPIDGTIELGLIDRWHSAPAEPVRFSVPAGGAVTQAFTVTAGKGTYSAHYPIHAYARFTLDGKPRTAHPILILQTELADPPRVTRPLAFAPVTAPSDGQLSLWSVPSLSRGDCAVGKGAASDAGRLAGLRADESSEREHRAANARRRQPISHVPPPALVRRPTGPHPRRVAARAAQDHAAVAEIRQRHQRGGHRRRRRDVPRPSARDRRPGRPRGRNRLRSPHRRQNLAGGVRRPEPFRGQDRSAADRVAPRAEERHLVGPLLLGRAATGDRRTAQADGVSAQGRDRLAAAGHAQSGPARYEVRLWPGRRGLFDATIAFSDGTRQLAFHGFEARVLGDEISRSRFAHVARGGRRGAERGRLPGAAPHEEPAGQLRPGRAAVGRTGHAPGGVPPGEHAAGPAVAGVLSRRPRRRPLERDGRADLRRAGQRHPPAQGAVRPGLRRPPPRHVVRRLRLRAGHVAGRRPSTCRATG